MRRVTPRGSRASATVTVINVATNATQTVVTDAQGFYRVPALEPGRYTVTTELSGFRKVEQRDIDVRPALETPLDVRLEPAGVGESIQVTADAGTAGLNKTNPNIATSINARSRNCRSRADATSTTSS